MVPSPCTVRGDLQGRYTLLLQIKASGAVRHNSARRGYVVGGNTVAHFNQTARFVDGLDLVHLHGDVIEKWRPADIARLGPAVQLALLDRQIPPVLRSEERRVGKECSGRGARD